MLDKPMEILEHEIDIYGKAFERNHNTTTLKRKRKILGGKQNNNTKQQRIRNPPIANTESFTFLNKYSKETTF